MLRFAQSLTQIMFKQKHIFTLFLIVLLFSSCTAKSPQIINMHEHLQSDQDVEKLLQANEKVGIEKTVLLGSPKETLLFDGSRGFSGYDENNRVLLDVAKKYPDKILAFCTIYWSDEDKLNKLKKCVEEGAEGLKLYNGHGFYYEMPLDDLRMREIYDYLEEANLPVLYHVNGGKYLKEFRAVLEQHPKMKVICPHFCLLSGNLSALEKLLDDYPNLYLDISFGYVDYMKEGFERFNSDIDKYRNFIIKYQDRLVFGTDAVVTDASFKNAEWLAQVFNFYRQWLEDENFTFTVEKPNKINIEVKGLQLPSEVVEKIYHANAEMFLGL